MASRDRGGKRERGEEVRKAVRSLRNAGKHGISMKELGRDEGLYLGQAKREALAAALIKAGIAVWADRRFFLRAAPPTANDAASIAAAAENYYAFRQQGHI